MAWYLAVDPERDHPAGLPTLEPGTRVVFDPAHELELRERLMGRRPEPDLGEPDEMAVYTDPRDVRAWPCRLWLVDDVAGVVRPGPQSRWAHAESFTVVEMMSTWLIFGPRGDDVARVVDEARELTGARVDGLAARPDADEAATYRRLLAARPWEPETDRPVGPGLEAVTAAVAEAAARAGGDPGDERWLSAGRAARAAALAAGTADLLPETDRTALGARWRHVHGPG